MALVSLKAVSEYDEIKLTEALRSCLEALGGMKAFVKPGQRVLLKPNCLAAFHPDRAITTHPSIVKAVAVLVQEAGGKVIVGDSPGYGSPLETLKKCGIVEALKDLSVEFGDFENEWVFEDANNKVARRIGLVKALYDADVIISLPKLKTHAQMTLTAALKNQYGLVPGFEKAKYHYRMKNREWLAALMIDINIISKPVLAIVDAVVAMEGEGPSGGDPRSIGAVMASADLPALDMIACKLINLDPQSVPLLQEARRRGYGTTDYAKIEVLGDSWESLQVKDFKKVREIISSLRLLPIPTKLLEWMQERLAAKPRIIEEKCIKCMACNKGCPVEPAAINPREEGTVKVFDERCIRCYCCHEFCPVKAIELKSSLLGRVFGM